MKSIDKHPSHRFEKACNLLGTGAVKSLTLYLIRIFQRMGKNFCVESKGDFWDSTQNISPIQGRFAQQSNLKSS